MTHYFPTKKNIVLGLIIWASILVPLGFIAYNLYQAFDLTELLIIILVFIPSIILLYVVWFRTRYFVSNETLKIKIGPLTEREVEISEIISVKRSFSLIASPANSFRRLEIRYRGGKVLISPVRESEFLLLLSQLNERVRIEV
jgi:PH (Pleckstrin Homology) domain-containing protein